MTLDDILIAKEGENFEFKEAKNRFDYGELVKYACAMSNLGGGCIVFGVTDHRPRQVVGSQAFDQPERTRRGLIDKLKVCVDFTTSREVRLPNSPKRFPRWREAQFKDFFENCAI